MTARTVTEQLVMDTFAAAMIAGADELHAAVVAYGDARVRAERARVQVRSAKQAAAAARAVRRPARQSKQTPARIIGAPHVGVVVVLGKGRTARDCFVCVVDGRAQWRAYVEPHQWEPTGYVVPLPRILGGRPAATWMDACSLQAERQRVRRARMTATTEAA